MNGRTLRIASEKGTVSVIHIAAADCPLSPESRDKAQAAVVQGTSICF